MKKKFIVIGLVSALLAAGVMGSAFVNISYAINSTGVINPEAPCGYTSGVGAEFDICPTFTVGPNVSVSGNAITISGSYFAGNGTSQISCNSVSPYVVEGLSTNSISYSASDEPGPSGISPHVTQPAVAGSCFGGSGQGEKGDFSVTFTDSSLSSATTLKIVYTNSAGYDAIDTFSGLVATTPPPPPVLPSVSLTASPKSLTLGGSTIITITTKNVTSCTGTGNDNGKWNGPQTPNSGVSETPAALGSAIFGITCSGPGGKATTSITVPVTAPTNPPPGKTGTITVTSENSVLGNRVLVPAQWDIFDGGGNDICEAKGAVCEGNSGTYSNQPAGAVTIPKSSVSLLNDSGLYGETVTTPTGESLAQTLVAGKTVAFVLFWNPIADMAVSPTKLGVTADAGASTSGQVQITNTGAPGSTLTWTSSVGGYTGNGSGWLTVKPSNDSIENPASGDNSENVTINADASKLSAGTYTAMVTLTGASAPQASPKALSASVAVTFTVKPAGASQQYFICTNPSIPSCTMTATPGYTSCSAACAGSAPSGPKVSSVSVSCGSPLYTGASEQCKATVSGTGSFSTGVTWEAPNIGTIDQSGNYTAPGTTGTATVSACSSEAGFTSVCSPPADIAIIAPAFAPPVCTALNANPPSIVIPESSNLTYSCTPVATTGCQITGRGTPPYSGDGTGGESVTPTSTTTYTLTCQNSQGGPHITSTARVTVGGSTFCEQNPNGAGCPGQ